MSRYIIVKTDEFGRTLNEYYVNAGWCLNREAADTFDIDDADQLIDDLNDYWTNKGYPIRADRTFAPE